MWFSFKSSKLILRSIRFVMSKFVVTGLFSTFPFCRKFYIAYLLLSYKIFQGTYLFNSLPTKTLKMNGISHSIFCDFTNIE